MSKLDKLAQIAQAERAEVEIAAALERLRAARAVLEQFDAQGTEMADITIAQTEALYRRVLVA